MHARYATRRYNTPPSSKPTPLHNTALHGWLNPRTQQQTQRGNHVQLIAGSCNLLLANAHRIAPTKGMVDHLTISCSDL
jgi:hypothetical protein